MELFYEEGHNERYVDIHPMDRWKYPDRVELGMSVYRREKTYDELKNGVDMETALHLMGCEGRRKHFEKLLRKPLPDQFMFSGTELRFLAKDRPITRACEK